MREYTPDLFAEDSIQAFNRSVPASRFLNHGRGFDWSRYARSRVYADFYQSREIGFLCGVLPTGSQYGSDQMFGVLLVTPSLSRHFQNRDYARLRQLESPLRAAARRIGRFRELDKKCDVLGQLLVQQQKAFVLWDPELRLVCVSEGAQRRLEGGLLRGDLEDAARAALRHARGTGGSAGATLLGRPRRISSARGSLLVEFSWIAGSDRRPWLLAELEDCSGERALLANLTSAESRVLRLLVEGLSTLEIAERLQVSRETVKTHVSAFSASSG